MPDFLAVTAVKGWHAHVYFDADTVAQARALCLATVEAFPDVVMGRVHEQPVGPHPDWSCQLGFSDARVAQVLGFLALNRAGLTVFIHPITGRDLIDHRDRAIWMGAIRPLILDALPDDPVDYEHLGFRSQGSGMDR